MDQSTWHSLCFIDWEISYFVMWKHQGNQLNSLSQKTRPRSYLLKWFRKCLTYISTRAFKYCKREHLPRSCKFFLMVKITEVPTRSIVLNLFYRMQQKFRRSTVKKGRITLERNWLIDHGLTISTMGLRSRVIRPFLTVDRRNFCCIR